MIKLAVTGNIASGKTLIESFLKEERIIVIDTDKIVHKLLSENIEVIEKVNNLFEEKVKDEKGGINRKKVGEIVFKDKNKFRQLEEILHPEVKKEVDKFFEENKNEKIVAVTVPQLYETGWEKFFDYVLLVTAKDELRIERLINRNNMSKEQAEARMNAQISQEEKAKRADFVLDNSGDNETARIQIKKLLEKLNKML